MKPASPDFPVGRQIAGEPESSLSMPEGSLDR
jgi:hypothetical protein